MESHRTSSSCEDSPKAEAFLWQQALSRRLITSSRHTSRQQNWNGCGKAEGFLPNSLNISQDGDSQGTWMPCRKEQCSLPTSPSFESRRRFPRLSSLKAG